MGYKLPNAMRKELKNPIGKIIRGHETKVTEKAIEYITEIKPRIWVTIGDFCTNAFLKLNYYPNIVIFDEKTRRFSFDNLDLKKYTIKTVINPPEWITNQSWALIESTISFCTSNNCRVAIRIQGEEDLLVIPTLLLLPINSIVVYGQPPFNKNEDGGLVIVNIDSEIKEKVTAVLKRFEHHEELINGNYDNRR